MKDINITDAIYNRLDRYRLRRTVDDGHSKVWTEPWNEFFQRHFNSNVFIGTENIIEPDEIDVSDIGMLED